MSEEEKKAIEYAEWRLQILKKEIEERQNDEVKGYGTPEDIAKLKYCNLHTLLNLIQKQQKELEKKDYLTHTMEAEFNRLEDLEDNTDMLKMELEKKDKIIDKMAEMLRYYNGMKQEQCFCIDICKNKNCDENNCFYRIIEYFIKLVEDK